MENVSTLIEIKIAEFYCAQERNRLDFYGGHETDPCKKTCVEKNRKRDGYMCAHKSNWTFLFFSHSHQLVSCKKN